MSSEFVMKVLGPVAGAAVTATVTFLVRGRRIPRLGHAIGDGAKRTAEAVWHRTNVVVYVAILTAGLYGAYTSHRQAEETATNRIVLCLLYGPLLDAVSLNQLKIANPHIYGLSPVAVENLRALTGKYEVATRALKGSGCTR